MWGLPSVTAIGHLCTSRQLRELTGPFVLGKRWQHILLWISTRFLEIHVKWTNWWYKWCNMDLHWLSDGTLPFDRWHEAALNFDSFLSFFCFYFTYIQQLCQYSPLFYNRLSSDIFSGCGLITVGLMKCIWFRPSRSKIRVIVTADNKVSEK